MCIFNDGVIFKQDIIEAGTVQVIENSNSGSQNSNSSVNESYFEQKRPGLSQSGGSKELKSRISKGKLQHSGGSFNKEEVK